MVPPSERTPLRQSDSVPSYVFITHQNREYKKKIRKFQCCICAAMLAIFITALVVTVSYSVNHDPEDANTTSSTPNQSFTQDSTLTTLLTMSWPLTDKPYEMFDDPLNETEIDEALKEGQLSLQQKENFENKVPALQVDSPSYRHQMSTRTSEAARVLARTGFVMESATRHVYSKRPHAVGKKYTREIKSELLPPQVCNPTADNACNESPYRTADGSCNNLAHPRSWGVAMRPFRRILPAEYGDGVSAPRKAQDGGRLPPARQISLEVHRPIYRDDPHFTVMLAVWGQFIDHDITATALSQGQSGSSISCCYAYVQTGIKNHPECYTVSIQTPDPYFDQYNVSCMEFVRSSPSPTCSFGPREQMNQASSFLDASVVYGTSDKLMDQLRTFEGGELKMLLAPDGRELLPVSTDPNDGCNQEQQLSQGRYCFLSGDARSNENIHLTTMHLLFARQHNQITRKLSKINPNWPDEKLFQEARKIISAEIQHITYNEFLPVILGPRLLEKLRMTSRGSDYSDVYDSGLDPTIANSFAASAFRFGHTLLPGLVRMIAGDYKSDEYVEMHKMLFNPFELYEDGFLEKAVRGAMNTHVEKVDTYFNPEFTQHLFERKPSIGRPKKGMCGLDLVSLNVQRGRDHGLPGYPSFREHCGLDRPKTFQDLELFMDSDSLDLIKKLYKTVDDIDMYTGVLAEIPLNGSLLGPTVTCLLTDQFLRLQRGDRFWYGTSEQPQAFTPAQLDVIRNITLAKVICDTSGIEQAQPKVMETIQTGNERQYCEELPEFDLSAWRETTFPSVETMKDKPGKVWLIKSSAPSKPQAMKLSGYVESGNVTVQGIALWSGTTPVKFPAQLFQAVADFSDFLTYPPVYSYGVLWSATGLNRIMGTFSLPFYSPNGSINWYNGDFSLQVQWADVNEEFLPVQGTYSSPLNFNNLSRNSTAPAPAPAPAVNSDNLNIPFAKYPDLAENSHPAPIILDGTLDPDGNFFSWSGNFSIILSKPEKTVQSENLQLAFTPKSYTRFIKIGGKVSGGSVSVQGHSFFLGDGNLPIAIPVDPFDTVADLNDNSANNNAIVYGHGINWKGSILSKSLGSATLSAEFSLPIFVHSNGIAPFSIRWYNGDCSFDFDILWQSTLDSVLSITAGFTTNVYFSDRKQYDYLKDISAENLFHDVGYSGSPKQFEGSSSKLILSGTHAKDGKTFLWSGNFTLILPQEIPLTQAGTLDTKQPLRLIGGQVSVNGQNVWYNTLPLGIPTSVLNPSGPKMLWTGSVQSFGDSFIKIHGSFSFPVENASWLNGNFDLQFQSNETFSLSGHFSTAIRLAEVPSIESLPENSANPFRKSVVTRLPKENLENTTNLSVVLLGMYSIDRTEFLWSGQCILELPPPSTSPFIQSNVVDSSKIKINGVVRNTSMGKPPTNIPITLFESVLTKSATTNEPPVYGQGILWSIALSNTNNYLVQFSLPSFANKKVIWYNGNFSVDFERAINIQQGQNFSSAVLFKSKKTLRPDEISENNSFHLSADDEPLVSPNTLESMAPIILYGEYSPNKLMFLWNGEITVIVPKLTKKVFEGGPKENRFVISAFTKGGSITTSGSAVWIGNRVPLAIPSEFLLPFDASKKHVNGHSVPWRGYISSESPKRVKIWGTYSAVTHLHDWYNGDFAFDLKLLGASEINVALNGTFLTYFYYQEIKSDSALGLVPEWTLAAKSPPTALPQTFLNSTNNKSFIPVLLHGCFSQDRLSFIWSGNVTVIVHNYTAT